MVCSAYFVKSTPLELSLDLFNTLQHVTGIFKMCMWKFDAKKNIFDKMTGF